ncbi:MULTISPECIES: GNAT family N-acetyltransferase [unclassified Clostridium]|uniref:GNAT family N-acetyltransferase n=1 Tax=Clostridium TaxID=1485 RepID=UPI001C8CAABC|nr:MULTISPECIES: GNAT family N-acetyltransferase [unclassified Clostridium]MBX9137430.1 GNAT family N-acetyltransferase [Clostridium sp. K12(2020)]MBX9144246.1 GNAT family N-acetyltransferase [Clostridium sp. K13]MDU2289872.1 GNAT family N-acetyltransferase [Clostridium celatum]MDU4325802.1 GNAT family N-acetyltransferase [Clostridium celatum]
MDLKIRFAEINDLDSCVELDLHKNIDTIKNKISMKEVIVAESNNEVIGCLKIEYIWTHLPFISYIVIKNDFRASGVGKSMLTFLEEYLRNNGQDTLLSSTMTDALRPQKWHLKMGFVECGMLCGINDDGVGEIFFKKAL